MKFFLAIKQIEFAAKLFAAAGFTAFETAFAAKDENALKAHLEKSAPAKMVEPTAEQMLALVTDELRASLIDAGIAVKADEDPLAVLKATLAKSATQTAQLSAISAAKITFAADAKPEAVTAALNSRISMAAGEELAKRGLRDFPEQKVEPDPTKPGTTAKTMDIAEWRALDAHKRAQFFRTGGQLTDASRN